MKLISLAEWLRVLSMSRRFALALLLGLVTALAFPPHNLTVVMAVTFPGLILLLRGVVSPRQAFGIGWAFSFGWFVLGLYWISAAMFVDIAHFWWAVPLAVAGLPFFLALFYGTATAIAYKAGLRGLSGILTFALSWFLADYARGHVLTGFPWLLAGYGWDAFLPVLQATSLFGIYGLTLVTLVVMSLPALVFDKAKTGLSVAVSGFILLFLLGLWGDHRLSLQSETISASAKPARLRLVQPNTDQAHKWRMDEREDHFQQLLDLTSAKGVAPVDAVIWPETAATFYLDEDATHRWMLARRVPDQGVAITGVLRREETADGRARYYNSLIAVDQQAQIVSSYDKFHLVPFGEYIPLRKVLKLRTLASLGVDFAAGDGPHTLKAGHLPSFSPLICYEAIFPGKVALTNDQRPEFLLSVTNDGWYGKTAGPYQHFAISRIRAIEEGLPLVRAANTGISGFVDPYGRVLAKLAVGVSGFVDGDLPQALPPTLYSLYGDRITWGLFAGLLLVIVILRRSSRITHS